MYKTTFAVPSSDEEKAEKDYITNEPHSYSKFLDVVARRRSSRAGMYKTTFAVPSSDEEKCERDHIKETRGGSASQGRGSAWFKVGGQITGYIYL